MEKALDHQINYQGTWIQSEKLRNLKYNDLNFKDRQRPDGCI